MIADACNHSLLIGKLSCGFPFQTPGVSQGCVKKRIKKERKARAPGKAKSGKKKGIRSGQIPKREEGESHRNREAQMDEENVGNEGHRWKTVNDMIARNWYRSRLRKVVS